MLRANEQDIDLGTLKYGQPFAFRYTLYNDGQSSVFIKKLVKQCHSCTEAFTSTTQIEKGGSGLISVTFTPGHIGKTTKSISVLYNDDKELKLTFKADVHE